MFERLHEATLPFLEFVYAIYNPLLTVLFILLLYFLSTSRRLNAYSAAPSHPMPLLRHFALALEPKEDPHIKTRKSKSGKNSKHAVQAYKKELLPPPLHPTMLAVLQELKLHWLLRKSDWLLRDKLKLLPDSRKGRRLNFAFMLFCVLTIMAIVVYLDGLDTGILVPHRSPDPTQPSLFFLNFLYGPLTVLALAALYFSFLNNRELNLDIFALLVLLKTILDKFFICWRNNCCFGKPWPEGVYCNRLETAVFPIQLLECSVGLLLFILCLLFMLYSKSYKPGRGAALCLFSFAVPRFVWDYLRYLGPLYRQAETNGLLGLSIMQTICIALTALAVIWWFALPLEKKLMDRFNRFLVLGSQRVAKKSRFLAKWTSWRNSAIVR